MDTDREIQEQLNAYEEYFLNQTSPAMDNNTAKSKSFSRSKLMKEGTSTQSLSKLLNQANERNILENGENQKFDTM